MAPRHLNVQNRQLHKRRLGAAPRPYILQPLLTPEPVFREQASVQQMHNLPSVSPKYHPVPKYDTQGHKVSHVPTTRVAGPTDLDLQLIALPEAAERAKLARRPVLGGSPRGDHHGHNSPQRGLPREYEIEDGRGIFEIDGEWVDKSANFKKPDGRRYKIHERRLNPAPKPVTKPSLYLDPPAGTDMSPNAHARKHDYVTFLTMGELGPGPTLRDVAEKAVGLQDRLDAINDANTSVEESVETLRRLQQSWGMQRAEALQWGSGLERPAVLQNAPSRQFRTNVSLKDLSYRVVQEGKQQVGYELNNGTLIRKGKVPVKVAGQWSMFKGEPKQLAPAAPINFNSKKQVQRELRRQRVKGKVEDKHQDDSDDTNKPMTDHELKQVMSQVMCSVSEMRTDMKAMKHEMESTDPDQLNKMEEAKYAADTKPASPSGLTDDLVTIKGKLEENKAFNQSHAKGHIYIGDGQSQELVAIAGMDAGDDDDLEDRSATTHLHRTC